MNQPSSDILTAPIIIVGGGPVGLMLALFLDRHMVQSVVFNEDDARSRKNHAPENLAILRRLAQNIWRTHPDTRPIGRKMKLASWSKDYFFSAFAHLQ